MRIIGINEYFKQNNSHITFYTKPFHTQYIAEAHSSSPASNHTVHKNVKK